MSKSAATTLIFSGSDQIVRMDFGPLPSRTLLFSWQIGKLPGQSIGQVVDVALEAKARCGKDVWVLCEDVWTQSMTLAAQAVAGLSDEQLERVLGFEMESLSGLNAADSTAGFVRGPQDAGLASFWVTQMSQVDCRQIQQLVHRFGGRLRGICHPAGLPLAWQKPAGGLPWHRVEAWGEFTLCLAGQPDGTVNSRFINGTPAQENWRPAITQWLAQSKARQVELLCKGQTLPDDALDGWPELLRLPGLEGQGLERWMKLWVGALTEYRGQVPVIRPPAKTVSRGQYVRLSAMIAVAALALCIGHGYWMKQRVIDSQAEVEKAQRPRKEVAELSRRISAMETELKQLFKSRHGSVENDPADSLLRQKKRIPALFRAMSQLSSDERVITHIRTEGRGSVTVEGLCLRPESADSLAVGLERELGPLGWEVRGAQKSARMINPDGGPWEFKVTLLPSGTVSQPGNHSVVGAVDKSGTSAGGVQ